MKRKQKKKIKFGLVVVSMALTPFSPSKKTVFQQILFISKKKWIKTVFFEGEKAVNAIDTKTRPNLNIFIVFFSFDSRG